MKRFALLAAAVLLAAGCAGSPTGPARTPAYGDGYKDGCESGRASQSVFGRPAKDAGRYASDPQYAQGWSDGFSKCEDEELLRISTVSL